MGIKLSIKNQFFWLFTIANFFFGASLHAQCEDRSNYWEESWVSCQSSPNPNPSRDQMQWLLFEFTEPQAFSTSQIWNANRTNESGLGPKEVYIDIFTDGNTWVSLSDEPFVWPKGTEADDYMGFDGPDFSSFGFIKKVLITVVSNYGGDPCGC